MRTLKLSIFFILFLIFLGCEESIDWELKPENNERLVVEAIITNENIRQEIILSISQDNPNESAKPAIGASVLINSNSETYIFEENINNPGHYLSLEAIPLSSHKLYRLEIIWNDKNYEAKSYMLQVKPFVPLSLKPEKTDSFSIQSVASIYLPNEQAMYEIDIDWTHISGNDSSKAKVYYFTFNTIDVSEIFSPSTAPVIFPKGSIIIEKKYSLNYQMAEYFRAILMETQWQSGVFDEASAPIPSNINNDALGLFGLSAVVSDTIIAQ
ncbi:MAG TPA: DUF4249 family protein [Bacteroidetes bacterium]|nr:DUF4249 family protein [Bacteroidota bacterium]